jgi:hypothetical protein
VVDVGDERHVAELFGGWRHEGSMLPAQERFAARRQPIADFEADR